jgi:CRP/FNR family transcriptional regulator
MSERVLPIAISAAIAASELADVPAAELAELFVPGEPVQLPAGSDLVAPPGDRAFSYLVTSGLLRTYTIGDHGRQTTLRYARRGALIGIPSLFHGPVVGVSVQAVTNASAAPIDADRVRALARRSASIAHALLVDQTALVNQYLQTFSGTANASLRENVLRHLLDLATRRSADGALVARVSQQALANHAGTVREVVARLLGELREQGLIRVARGEILLVDPDALAAATWPRTF